MGDEHLRFGFTIDHVDHLVRGALKCDRSTRGMDASDRRDAAWFAVVDALYSASEAPARDELFAAAMSGLHELWRDDFRTRGFARVRGGHTKAAGPATAPGFARYWLPPVHQVREEATFVPTVVDQLALRQVFARLTSEQRETLLALAVHQDHHTAARALALSVGEFCERLTRARRKFTQLWHDHETAPGRMWRKSQRVGRRDLPARVAAVLDPGELPAVLLADAIEVFTRCGADRMPSRDLLALLAADRPHLYGQWTLHDLAAAFRVCGIPPTGLKIGGHSMSGYRRQGIEQAAGDAREAGPAALDECGVILAAWLHQEQDRCRAERTAAGITRDHIMELITAAGPGGITAPELAAALPAATTGALYGWLSGAAKAGLVIRPQRGRYVAAQHAAAAPGDPHARMLRLVHEAGPDGISMAALARQMDGAAHPGTIGHWLRQERAHGTITRSARGVYTARAGA